MFTFIQARKLAATLALLFAALTHSMADAQEEAIAEAVVEPIAEVQDEAKGETPQLRPLTVTAGLVDDTGMTGTLIDSTALQIKTAFGEASIPLSEVAGIRFPAADQSSTTVVMLNGDSISGATDLKFINIETSWGSAKINGQNIGTMLFVPGLKWESTDSIGGKRWNLIEATAQAAPPQTSPSQQGQVQQAGGVRIQNSQQPPRIIFGQ
jgi:hypothetical protein